MDPIRFSVERFLHGESYLQVGGRAGKAVPLEYIEGLTDKILAYLETRYPAHDWVMERGKWGTEIVGYLKEMPDPTPGVIDDIRFHILDGKDYITLEEAEAFNTKE